MNMNSLLSINRSALNGLQKNLDTTAYNIANINSSGFKGKETSFKELLPDPTSTNELARAQTAEALDNSRGMTVLNQSQDFRQATISETGQPYDMAIDGNGFFGVRDKNGQLYLTRDGSFHLDSKGDLVNKNGLTVEMSNQNLQPWPKGSVVIDSKGVVTINSSQGNQVVGEIVLFMPQNDTELIERSQQLFQPTGLLQSSTDTPAIFGNIHSQALENANVDLATSMVDMMSTQRAYSLNLQVLQSTDDMSSIINRMTD